MMKLCVLTLKPESGFGTPLKGALRTAYLNALAEGRNTALQEKKISSRDLERILLEGSFETDPFLKRRCATDIERRTKKEG